MGPLKPERPKGTERREREKRETRLKQGIQRLAWEVVKARRPGCKAQGPSKSIVGPPAQKRAGPQIQRPQQMVEDTDTETYRHTTAVQGHTEQRRQPGNPRR